jgi:hypothetical protein
MLRPLCALLLALPLAACGDDVVVSCDVPDDVLRSSAPLAPAGSDRLLAAPVAVRVTVVDSASGASLAAGASGAFVTGTFADSLHHDDPALLTAYGPAGRYSLVVQHPGYASWGRDDVRVRAGECGMATVELTARLQRVGG